MSDLADAPIRRSTRLTSKQKGKDEDGESTAKKDIETSNKKRKKAHPSTDDTTAAMTSRLCLPNETLAKLHPQIWNPGYTKLHPPLNQQKARENWEYDEEQSYSEYVEMANREPNAEGTGRFVLSSSRRTIGLLDLTTQEKKENAKGTAETNNKNRSSDSGHGVLENDRTSRLATFLEAYLGLSVSIRTGRAEGITLRTTKGGKRGCRIDDRKRGLSFPLSLLRESGRGGRCFVDVFSIFDVAVEYLRPTEYSLLVLMDVSLGEWLGDDVEDCNGEIQEVLGRACGDRVAVVNYLTSEANDIELFGTAAHELLHTMGLDHTTHWQCLMNPCYFEGRECMFLAPHNVRKLMNFLGEERNEQFVLKRYRLLMEKWWVVFDKSSPGASDNYNWLKQKVLLMEKFSC
eukprot:CAMPEP_0183745918 /NCGR_PEP_ID=MMETSP0737-20130205/66482_1 /TAXON_ID=385413 /ORGANISM="Thalassiosira miniscula, Strain CCMP1093" /LENGTH=402 /DNA_ID=CAMNT_0025981597 /DNA_START=2178 /DNA_END=3386 /DNA_ORIENTATION=-